MNTINTLDKQFFIFTKKTIANKKPDNIYVISQLQKYQSLYRKSGYQADFLSRLAEFAYNMENNQLLDLAGIVFSRLAKLPIMPELKEQFLKGGLRVSRKQGDLIHSLARIVDLKKLYEQNGKTSKRTKMLFQEEQVLENITKNFLDAKDKYKTVAKNPTALNKYKLQLARVKVNIAKTLSTNAARAKFNEALNIYQEIGADEELQFVKKFIAQSARQH